MANEATQIVVEAEITGQPGFSGGQPDHSRQPAENEIISQPGTETLPEMNKSMSSMATLLEQFVARGEPRQRCTQQYDVEDGESEPAPWPGNHLEPIEIKAYSSEPQLCPVNIYDTT